MKRSLAIMLTLLVLALGAGGCSRTQKVVVMKGDLNAAYEALGQIEVNRNAPRMSLKRGFQCVGEWVTFGHYRRPSQEEYLQGILDKALVKAARKRYGAEAVTQVQYWPDLSAEKFPHGKIYAKGQMVRYKRFAS